MPQDSKKLQTPRHAMQGLAGTIPDRSSFLCRLIESEPDVVKLKPTPQDSFVIMASDGLWDVLEDQEAVSIVQVPSQTSDAVIKTC